MSVQIRILTKNGKTRERKENRTRQCYKRLYRENQETEGLYVQEWNVAGIIKGGINNIQTLIMNQKRPTTQGKQQTTRKQH